MLTVRYLLVTVKPWKYLEELMWKKR